MKLLQLLSAVVLVSVVGMSGCSHKLPRPDHGPLKKISLIPVNNPREFEVANENFFARFFGLASLAVFMENNRKTSKFSEKMREEQATMGQKLTKAVIEELTAQGYEVELIERPQAEGRNPENIEYAKIHADGPVLHVWIQDVGLQSPKFRNDYLPKLTIGVELIHPLDEEFLYEEWLYYGAEAKKGKNWSVPGEPRFLFANFEQVANNPDQVIQDWDDGFRATAKHIGTEFRRAVK